MTKIFNRLTSFALFSLLLVFAVTVAFESEYIDTVREGINLWATCVLPALFPYFFITALLSSLSFTSTFSKKLSPITTKLFSVNGAVGYALFMSLLSGYPIGAKMVSDLKESGLIDENESVRASALCSSSSPMFILGSVGNIMFNNRLFGVCLFLCHLLCVLIIGLIFRNYKRGCPPKNNSRLIATKRVDNVLYESVFTSVINVLTVGGLITVFYLLSEILLKTGIYSPIVYFFSFLFKDDSLGRGVALGLLECTRGLKALSSGKLTRLSLPCAAALCGFGGISVISQSLAFLKKAKIKTAPFLFSKILSAVLNFIVAFVFNFIIF